MKAIKIISSLVLTSVLTQSICAAEYSSNKKYTYEEISEILSSKILDNRTRIESLERTIDTSKLESNQEIETLNKKISELYKLIKQNEVAKPVAKPVATPPAAKEKTSKNSIVFDKELYDKVR